MRLNFAKQEFLTSKQASNNYLLLQDAFLAAIQQIWAYAALRHVPELPELPLSIHLPTLKDEQLSWLIANIPRQENLHYILYKMKYEF